VPEIPDDPLIPRGSPDLIAAQEKLTELIDHLRQAGSFAYDSEFIGELTYFPKICLIQVASSQRVALIDPLADLDLAPLWELMCDPSVEKVLHAGQQDLEPVVRHLGRGPANVIDTQIVAGLAGLPYPVSLSKLAAEVAGARLGKGLTFTHWDQRPLSAMQIRYAADDVRYLPLIRQGIGAKLQELGHTAWACEECLTLCDSSYYRFDPEAQYLRVRGANSLAPRQLAVLRSLTAWRDAGARQADLPPRTFLRDEVLLDLARNPVQSVQKLQRVRGLPRPVEAEHGPAIVQLTAETMALPEAQLLVAKEPEASPSEKFRADSLWYMAQSICAAQQIDPALVMSRQEFGDFLVALREGAASGESRLLAGWRREAVGQPVIDLLNEKRRFGFACANQRLEMNQQ
jgi:ribonuclease D